VDVALQERRCLRALPPTAPSLLLLLPPHPRGWRVPARPRGSAPGCAARGWSEHRADAVEDDASAEQPPALRRAVPCRLRVLLGAGRSSTAARAGAGSRVATHPSPCGGGARGDLLLCEAQKAEQRRPGAMVLEDGDRLPRAPGQSCADILRPSGRCIAQSGRRIGPRQAGLGLRRGTWGAGRGRTRESRAAGAAAT
jgi:hypothetical protein